MATQIEWWRWILLILLFGALFTAWFWVNRGKLNWKKFVQPVQPQIKVLEKYWAGHQLLLLLIETNGEKFLLARTPGSLAWQKLESSPQKSKKDS